jgi:hypothetical protein
MPIRSNNKCELIACKKYEKQGYEVLKNGWPDFLLVNWVTKEVRFVEIKPKTKKLKPRQLKMKKAFALLNLKYEVDKIDARGTLPRGEEL